MLKLRENQEEINKNFQNYLMTNENDEQKLEKIMEYLSKDNTNCDIILAYLDLKEKLKKADLKQDIQHYSYCVKKDIINAKYGKYYKKKYSSMELFFLFYNKIENFSEDMNIKERIDYIKNLIIIEDEAYIDYNKINNYVSYMKNKELYIYLLIDTIRTSIKDQIKNFKYGKIDDNIDLIKNLKNELQDYLTYKKIKTYIENNNKTDNTPTKIEIQKYNNFIKNNAKLDIDQKIFDINDEITYISKVSSDLFNNYFRNFSLFFRTIKNKFYKRFSNLENTNNNDEFDLFIEFCFFICEFNFCNLPSKLINIWFYSLEQKEEEIDKLLKINSYENIVKYEIENKDLILKIYDYELKKISIFKVENYSNYIIQYIINYLYKHYDFIIKNENKKKEEESYLKKFSNFFAYYLNWFNTIDIRQFKVLKIKINEYEIEKYLKISEYKNELFIKKYYQYWKKYLIKIFTSKTIKSVFRKICSDVCTNFKEYDFINEKELEIIIDEIKYVQFPMEDTFALTLIDSLTIHEYYKGYNANYGENDSKLVYLSFNIIKTEHEALGHLNMRIQKLISGKDIKSPKPNINTKNLTERNEGESGDYIEELLFGSNKNRLSYKEILFILDIGNYECPFTEFKTKFLNCNNCKYELSNSFKKLMDDLGLIIDEDPDKANKIYNISQKLSKNENKEYPKPLQHRRGAFYYSPELKISYERQINDIIEHINKLEKK